MPVLADNKLDLQRPKHVPVAAAVVDEAVAIVAGQGRRASQRAAKRRAGNSTVSRDETEESEESDSLSSEENAL